MLTSLVLAATVASGAAAPPAVSGPAPADTLRPFVTGVPGVLWLDVPLWESLASSRRCFDFRVRAPADVIPAVMVTSTGAGDARLLLAADAERRSCDDSWTAGKAELSLRNVGLAGVGVRMIVPGAVFPRSGAPASASLLLIANRQAPIVASFTLQADAPGDITRGAFWALGIIVPAVLTAVIGYVSIRKQKAIERYDEERTAFEKFKRDNHAALTVTFGAYLDALHAQDGPEFCGALERELTTRQALQAVPERHRRPIVKALACGNRDDALRLLSKAFPEWKSKLEGLLTPWPSAVGNENGGSRGR
jgi:hypothetical protein